MEPCLAEFGVIFRAFREQDSGCSSFCVECHDASRWFVKHASEPAAVESLRRARRIHERVAHPALPALRNGFTTPRGGLALVYEWVSGEAVYDYVVCRAAGR